MKDGAEMAKLNASPARQTAQFFGERALMNAEPRAATVQVTSTTAKALALDRDSFVMLLGPLEDLMTRAKDAPVVVGGKKKKGQENPHDAPRDKILRKDLNKID